MPSKPLIQSKTFWLNALAAVIAVGTALSGVLPEGGQAVAIVAAVVNVANIALRFITDGKIDGLLSSGK